VGLVGGGLAVLVSIVGFTYLGATQTNRHKPWVVRLHAAQQEGRPTGSPRIPPPRLVSACTTVTIWLVALAAFAVLSFTVGWAWSGSPCLPRVVP